MSLQEEASTVPITQLMFLPGTMSWLASPVTARQLSPELPADRGLILARFLVKVAGYGRMVDTQPAPNKCSVQAAQLPKGAQFRA